MHTQWSVPIRIQSAMPVRPAEREDDQPPRKLHYAEALAASLVHYARLDQPFARQLAGLVSPLHLYQMVSLPRFPQELEILMPADGDTAERRAAWLVDRILAGDLPGAANAARILLTVSQIDPRGEPKLVVVGVFAVAIPGITLGRFRRRQIMPVLIRRDFAASEKFVLSRTVGQASVGVLRSALDLAQGRLEELEPEIDGWLFGDRAMHFYAADEMTMRGVERELRELEVAHAAVKADDQTVVLAVSPAVNGMYLEHYWEVEPLDI